MAPEILEHSGLANEFCAVRAVKKNIARFEDKIISFDKFVLDAIQVVDAQPTIVDAVHLQHAEPHAVWPRANRRPY